MARFTTQEDVEEEISLLERALAQLSDDDEWLSALLRNQKVMTEAVAGSNALGIGGFEPESLPRNTAGISIGRIEDGDMGLALFEVNGNKAVMKVRASGDIASNEVITITGEDDRVEPKGGVDPSKLAFGSTGVASGSFTRQETDENVEIEPGDKETVLEITDSNGGGIREVGTNDETYSLYDYVIDGESILEKPLKEPLGVYNNTYLFPEPVQFNGTFEVVVKRTEDASASAEYYSKATYYR